MSKRDSYRLVLDAMVAEASRGRARAAACVPSRARRKRSGSSGLGLLDGQLGGRDGLEPLVWNRLAAADRESVGARG